ncbi:MAG: amidophosphoribosyltransferase, partial [Actinobacteria bacterium]|nr:amidophosphoribosyltransferase [Actinomycetota bacterium]
ELVEATGVPKDSLCRACFDGVYPLPIPEPSIMGKHLLEGLQKRVSSTTDIDELQHP